MSCRLLAFFHTAFFDAVEREKERDDRRAFDGELRLVKAFAHYTGHRPEEIRKRFSRVHDDVLYEKRV